MVDPPWDVKRIEPVARWGKEKLVKVGNVELEYPTMTVEEISEIPVEDYAEDNAHLYLWTINKYVERSYAIVRDWGFIPSTLLTWCKPRKGMGLGGTFCQTTEYCLFARRGSCPSKQRIDSTWWEWPRGKHSAKPEAFLDMVESVSHAPYLELFARRNRLGWSTWGNECLEHIFLTDASNLRTVTANTAPFST